MNAHYPSRSSLFWGYGLLLFYLFFYTPTFSQQQVDPTLSATSFEAQLNDGIDQLKRHNVYKAKIVFKGIEKGNFPEWQQQEGRKLYLKAKHMEPFFKQWKQAEMYMAVEDFKQALELLNSTYEGFQQNQKHYTNADLDRYFQSSLANYMQEVETNRIVAYQQVLAYAKAITADSLEQALVYFQSARNMLYPPEIEEQQLDQKMGLLIDQLNYQQYLKEGKKSLAAGNLPFARELFQKGIEIEATEEMTALLAETEQLICAKQVETIKNALEIADFERAESLLKEDINCEQQAPEIGMLKEDLNEQMYQYHLNNGQGHLDEAAYGAALNSFNQANNYQATEELALLIKEAENHVQSQQLIQQAKERERIGLLEEAVEAYETADGFVPNPGVKDKIEAITSQQELVNRNKELAKKAMANGDLELAKHHLHIPDEMTVNDAEQNLLIQEINKRSHDYDKLLEKARQSINNGDRVAALRHIDAATKLNRTAELRTLRNEAQNLECQIEVMLQGSNQPYWNVYADIMDRSTQKRRSTASLERGYHTFNMDTTEEGETFLVMLYKKVKGEKVPLAKGDETLTLADLPFCDCSVQSYHVVKIEVENLLNK